MKKSKFLKNSKNMLSRSFNPSKCKTSLRMAGSRLKLLRNKKEVQVKQMKREIAQLLESGQDQTARIRVEHAIREEKMMAAYDLIEIYCELIVARLPIIESQKICPIDLKEAIASVVFASPRCGDVPELLDVRKHFTEKYGKDFTTAAIELRPECGVSRMLVEKLSAMAPDGQTKIKILSAIAEEHNVKWDAKSFEEKDSIPPNDLLTGPSTFEPPHFEGPDVQVPQSNKLHGLPLNFNQVDHRTTLGTERLTSPQISGVDTAFQHEARAQALGDERAQIFQGDSNTISLDRQRWNMEFKDATSAAQAAAESAELASMAARAAAELSSRGRITRQYSTESHNSDIHVLNDGRPEKYVNSELASEHFSEELMKRTFFEQTRLQNEQIDGMKPNNLKTDRRFENGHGVTKEYSQSSSIKSKSSMHNDTLDHGIPVVGGYSRKNSLKEVSRGEMSMQRESFKYKAESANGWPEKSENVREERIGKQPSLKSSHSHSSISSDENIFSNSEDQKFEYNAGGEPFLGFGKADIYREASQTSSRESAAVVFDKSDSDSEIHGFDTGPTYDEQEPRFHLPLAGQKSRAHLSINTDSGSPRSNPNKMVKSTTSSLFLTGKNSFSNFSENLRSVDGSKLDDSVPVTFDESDGPTSESDEDMNMSRHTGISRDLSKHNLSVGSKFKDKSWEIVGSPLKEKGSSGFDRKQLPLSSDDELKSEEMDMERNQGKKYVDPPAKLSTGKPSADQPPLEPKKSRIELNNINNSSPKSEEGLNFEKLTGGFRHKGYNRLPYLKDQFDVSSSINKESEETTATITRSTNPTVVESSRISTMFKHKKSTRMLDLQTESDSDSSEEEESLQKSSDLEQQELFTPIAGKEVKRKPSLAASNSIFGFDNGDLDEDLPKESLTRTSHLRSGISRRTKASRSSSEKNNYYKMQLRSEALDFDDGMDRKPTASNISETPKISESQRNSSKLEYYEPPTLAKVASKPAKSNFWGPPQHSNSGKATSETMQESKIRLQSEAYDSVATVERKPTKSYSPETRKQFHSLMGSSSQLGNSEQPTSAKLASKPTNSSFWETPDQHSSGKANSVTIQESKVTRKSSAIEELSRPQPKTQVSVSSKNLKAATLNKTSSNKDDGNQKASHVHPKLPDYDTLVQSLRKNRS